MSAKVSVVSLGCPKALVDSERLITELAASGFEPAEDGAEVTIVNTCGFIDAAREESFATIEELVSDGRQVVVTGCLGADAAAIRARFPSVAHVSPPDTARAVVSAVSTLVAPDPDVEYLTGPVGAKLTPEHYSYLKVAEGCNHRCAFCIIPSMRGPLRSRAIDDVLGEAERLVAAGTKELLVIAQDLSAYGSDRDYEPRHWRGREVSTRFIDLCSALGEIAPWVRLHYVYPYPHVDQVVPLMTSGAASSSPGVLPYLDMPLQHAAPAVLKAMRRPARAEHTLERVRGWREQCPQLCIRSTFIVGFPGETEDDFARLLDFIADAELDRVGCFTYSDVAGAAANDLPGHVDERLKLERQEALLEVQASVSARRTAGFVGLNLQVLVDQVADSTVVGRSFRDAPEIDGCVRFPDPGGIVPGDFATVRITDADEHDLEGTYVGRGVDLL